MDWRIIMLGVWVFFLLRGIYWRESVVQNNIEFLRRKFGPSPHEREVAEKAASFSLMLDIVVALVLCGSLL